MGFFSPPVITRVEFEADQVRQDDGLSTTNANIAAMAAAVDARRQYADKATDVAVSTVIDASPKLVNILHPTELAFSHQRAVGGTWGIAQTNFSVPVGGLFGYGISASIASSAGNVVFNFSAYVDGVLVPGSTLPVRVTSIGEPVTFAMAGRAVFTAPGKRWELWATASAGTPTLTIQGGQYLFNLVE